MSTTRTPTPVDALAERYLAEYAALDPAAATELGLPGHDAALPDLSPDGYAARSELRRRTLRRLAETPAVDDTDRVTVAALADQLEAAEQIRELGAEESRLSNIYSPLQNVRKVFDLMPTATVDDWATLAARLRQVPGTIEGYVRTLRRAASRGEVSARRQVLSSIREALETGAHNGYFDRLAKQAANAAVLPEPMRGDIGRGAEDAAAAYHMVADVLRHDILPQAPLRDAYGPERYAAFSRWHLGTSVDLRQTYEWAQDELRRITALMRETADRIVPGGVVAEAVAHLNRDPARTVTGVDALRDWMQETSEAAVAALADTHFDIPAPVRTLECRIAPTPGGTIYYTGPSEDFTRPGQIWWAVPEGATTFSTWRERSAVYHEGVPGHHLQVGQTAYRSGTLNRWRRIASWVDGHGEGWGLYAERLMAELGFLDDPGDLLGMLDSQSFRTVRVVIDVGFHCGFDAPAEVGGGAWDYDKAWRMLTAHSGKPESRLSFELERYLGLPGQAASYKIGERHWLELRDEVARREGAGFDLKRFHRRALDIGSVGLDVLRTAVLGTT